MIDINYMAYWLSPKISFKTFKLLNKKLYPKPDLVPVGADKILWKMLRERQINIFLSNGDDPLNITLKNIPRAAKLIK